MNEQTRQAIPAKVATQVAQPSPRVESDFQRLVNQPHKGTCEYVPYGAQDKIKLTVPIIQNLIAVPTKSGKTCSEKDAIRFLAMCQAQRLNPFAGDAYLIGYDAQDGPKFSLITAHQVFLKRAETNDAFGGMESGIILMEEDGAITERQGDFHLETEKVVGGWAKVHCKDRIPMYRRLSITQRKPKYPTSFWEGNKASEQIVKCAEADALRATFPTMLGGLYMHEETLERDPAFAKPTFTNGGPALFTEKEKVQAPASTPTAKPEKDDDGNGYTSPPAQEQPPEPAQEAPAQAAEPAAPSVNANPLKALRNLCKMGHVQEGALLDFLANMGTTDGSYTSLEEIQLQQPDIIRLAYDNWQDIAAKIKAEKGDK